MKDKLDVSMPAEFSVEISVIICTHNPRMDYLERVLEALRAQTMSCQRWELLVIDNCSDAPLREQIDLAWHPHGRCIREDDLGLTKARIRGIAELQAELIVFVDDDNVIDRDYLEQALRIAHEWPILGAWGGWYTPEFETPPPDCIKSQLWWFGHPIDKDKWACLPEPNESTPTGAGMVIRRKVAEVYAQSVRSDRIGLTLDRQGKLLLGFGDIDMASTSWDTGLGTGRFVALHLTHLIPSFRLTPPYVLRLIEDSEYSGLVFRWRRGIPIPQCSIYNRIYHFLRGLRRHGFERGVYFAQQRGIRRAIHDLYKGLP